MTDPRVASTEGCSVPWIREEFLYCTTGTAAFGSDFPVAPYER